MFLLFPDHFGDLILWIFFEITLNKNLVQLTVEN